MNYSYEEIDEHIQWLINFMKEEYPNNYKLVIGSNSGMIKNNLQAQMFLRKDLCSSEGFQKACEKPLNSIVNSIAKVAKEKSSQETDYKKCSHYKRCSHYTWGLCNLDNTIDMPLCPHNGNINECSFTVKE